MFCRNPPCQHRVVQFEPQLLASARGRVGVSQTPRRNLQVEKVAFHTLTLSFLPSSSGSEGGGSTEETAAFHWPLQVPAQFTQPFVCLCSLHSFCSHQPGGKWEREKPGSPPASPSPPQFTLKHSTFSLRLTLQPWSSFWEEQSACHPGLSVRSPQWLDSCPEVKLCV